MKLRCLRSMAGLFLTLAAGPLASVFGAAAPDFERQIAPILIRNCLRCHNASDPAGGLDLTDQGRAFVGGESGTAAIVPGKVDESYLLDRVREGEMPPPGKGQPISAEQIAQLQAWVEAGAPWPAGRILSLFELTTAERAGRDWWSLQRLKRPDVPTAAQADAPAGWVRTPIDAFILAGLGKHGLEPSTEADRRTLIRRATFDLWGLPPSPEDVATFVSDAAPDAYEKLIDRLLASSHYGEQWGQHWLDVVRFAESEGYETNRARPNAWPYRDYVIDALNRDIPYPQFILEQLAGDQCDVAAATGFLVAGAHDVVGSPDVELSRQQRHNDLDDMVSTTSQAFMALTVSCAKCHDHKFDPISQRDYYGLQAMFSGVLHGDRDVPQSLDEEHRRQRDAWRRSWPIWMPASVPWRPAPSHWLGSIDLRRGSPRGGRFARWAMSTASRRSRPGSCGFRSRAPIRPSPAWTSWKSLPPSTGRNVALASCGSKSHRVQRAGRRNLSDPSNRARHRRTVRQQPQLDSGRSRRSLDSG